MEQVTDWATHLIEWEGMYAYYDDERFIGFKKGREMWAGKWNDLEHKRAWLEIRTRLDKGRITELYPIQENE